MKRALALMLCCSLALAAAGCSKTTLTLAPSGTAVAAGAPTAGSADEWLSTKLADSVNEFGFDLLRVAAEDPDGKNVAISPFSIHDALSMAANGADGDTLDQMRSTLALDQLTEQDSNTSWANLIAHLEEATGTVEVANSLWLDDDYQFYQEFLDTDRSYFGAELRTLDLQAKEAINTINQWVSDNTHGKIPEILDEAGAPDAMCLVNAVYLKGDWSVPFNADNTQNEPFTTAAGDSVKVPTMHRDFQMDYAETDEYQVVSLGYSEGDLTMYVMLPAKDSSLDELAGSISAEELRSLRKNVASHAGHLALPRFTIEYGRDLTSDLDALGMVDAFSPGMADFSRMGDPRNQLYIGKVNHRAYVAVDEKGTEAAAATAVGMFAAAIGPTEVDTPFEMICDRPFLTLIVDNASGAVLFSTLVRDPRE